MSKSLLLFTFIAFLLALLIAPIAEAQRAEIEYIKVNETTVAPNKTIDIEINDLEESFRVEILAFNGASGTSPANYNIISASFPDFDSSTYTSNITLNSNTSNDLENNFAKYFGAVGGGDQYAEYIIVESSDNNGWVLNEQNKLVLDISPKDFGQFKIQYKVVMSSTTSWQQQYLTRDPANGTPDALGEAAFEIIVNIVEPETELEVDLQNVSGYNSELPGDDGIINLYNQANGSEIDEQNTDSRGEANFDNL
ncbi:MAG: hypothetical protein RLN68_14725, partial [Balneola sp.]